MNKNLRRLGKPRGRVIVRGNGKKTKPLTDRQWVLNNLLAIESSEDSRRKGFKSDKWQKDKKEKKKKFVFEETNDPADMTDEEIRDSIINQFEYYEEKD